MNKYGALALLVLVGCSAAENLPEWEPGFVDPVLETAPADATERAGLEFGTVQQALTAASGYGVNASTQSRCTVVGGAGCIIPKGKTFKFHNQLSSGCSGAYGSIMRDQGAAAIANVKTILENRGFTVTVDTSGGGTCTSSGSCTDVYLRCDSTTPDGTPISIAGTSPACVTPSGGGYCRLYSATIRINPSDMTTLLAQTTDAVKQGKFVLNTWQHEIGHTIVFGHKGSCVGNELMCPAAAMALNDPNTWGNRSYTNEEKGWLASFVP